VEKEQVNTQQSLLGKLISFVAVDIWRIRLEDLPFRKSFAIRQLRIIILAVRGFDRDKCLYRASSLTFYTLLSIVPVMAMLFGVAKGFGFEKMLQRDLVERFPGQEEIITQVIDFAQKLLDTTRGGLIAGIGLIILFWSVVKVLSHIEASLNDIWQIKEHRSWPRKFSDYLAVMLISPLFIIISSSATVFITTQITRITIKVKLLGMISPLIFLGLKLIPYVSIWILFTIIYILMPNTRVSLKSGLVAGIIAGTIFHIVQWGYISFQVGAARYNAIYGSFAALPLFLMWVQISWWVVLFGAELSFANQNVDTYEYEPDCLKISPAYRKLITLQIAHLLVRDFANGHRPLTDVQISKRLKIPIRLVHSILFQLVESGLISEARTATDKEFGYQPARDINTLSIHAVLEALDQHGTSNIPVVQTEELTVLSDAMQKFGHAVAGLPDNKLLKDI
jgi:membrane protein